MPLSLRVSRDSLLTRSSRAKRNSWDDRCLVSDASPVGQRHGRLYKHPWPLHNTRRSVYRALKYWPNCTTTCLSVPVALLFIGNDLGGDIETIRTSPGHVAIEPLPENGAGHRLPLLLCIILRVKSTPLPAMMPLIAAPIGYRIQS